jgi:type IV secretory pathway VirB6-like protein
MERLGRIRALVKSGRQIPSGGKNMKKLLSLLFASMVVFSLTLPAFAADTVTASSTTKTQTAKTTKTSATNETTKTLNAPKASPNSTNKTTKAHNAPKASPNATKSPKTS